MKNNFAIEDEEQRLSRLIDNETLFRFAYVPFVIAELVWDYIDTVINIAAWKQLQETKKLCRTIRELRREYEHIRACSLDSQHLASERENMFLFERGVKDITETLLLNLRSDIEGEYPELESDFVEYIVAVYQCHILLSALLDYTDKITSKVADMICRNVGHILPEPIYKLNRLVLEFAGDKPISVKFAKIKNRYIDVLANKITLVELNEI